MWLIDVHSALCEEDWVLLWREIHQDCLQRRLSFYIKIMNIGNNKKKLMLCKSGCIQDTLDSNLILMISCKAEITARAPEKKDKTDLSQRNKKQKQKTKQLFLFRLSITCVHLHIPRQTFAPTHSLTATLSKLAPGSLDDKKARYCF